MSSGINKMKNKAIDIPRIVHPIITKPNDFSGKLKTCEGPINAKPIQLPINEIKNKIFLGSFLIRKVDITVEKR